jgi:predicted ATPase
VALFLQAARRVQSSFQLTAETRAAVAYLCRLVEGMPLALELSASWVRLLSCTEIVRELEQNLSFLATSQRHVIERHQSMPAVFDHSWRLLSAEERRVFRQLSIFQGGFRREAAEQVTGASLRLLSALIDKSLLRRQPSGRYDLHKLLRQYAAARLAEEPEEQKEVQDRHGRYYMDYVWRQTEPLKGGRQSQTMVEMKPETDNIRLAWSWAVARGRITEIGRAVLGWSIFYDIQGRYHELKEACQQTVDKLESIWLNETAEERKREAGIVFGFMLATQGALYLRLGEFGGKSKELLQQGIILLRQLGARTELATALHYFGSLEVFLGEFTEAQALLQEGLALFREEQDQRGMGLCLAVLGMATGSLGQYAEAYQHLQQGVALLRTVDEQHYLGMSLGFLGDIVIQMGQLAEAKQLLQESLAITRALGDRWSMALCLNQLGIVTFLTGKDFWAEAKQLHQESLAISKELGEKYFSAISLNHLGRIHYALGEGQEATQSFMIVLRMAIESRAAPVALDILIGLATPIVHPETGVAEVELTLKEQALEWLALVLSHPASQYETKERANRLLAELESQLPPQVSAAARARGQSLSLEAVTAEILAEDMRGDFTHSS